MCGIERRRDNRTPGSVRRLLSPFTALSASSTLPNFTKQQPGPPQPIPSQQTDAHQTLPDSEREVNRSQLCQQEVTSLGPRGAVLDEGDLQHGTEFLEERTHLVKRTDQNRYDKKAKIAWMASHLKQLG